jgi:two-component system sensor histidine kinase CreC
MNPAMAIPRELYLVGIAALFLLGLAATAERLLRARRHGYSLRLQIFVPLAATTLALSSSFAAIVIDRFQSRASVFARKAAEDEARVVAALLVHTLDEKGSSLPQAAGDLEKSLVLQAFSRGATDTEVEVLDSAGSVQMRAGAAQARVGAPVVEASVPLVVPGAEEGAARMAGAVRVRKGSFGMLQLLNDVAPRVALLAFIFALVSAVAAVLLGGAVAIPIERLTRAAERVAAGERQAALPEPRGREVRALTHALESMRRELEQRHALEAFVADLSHELKNPIASIRAVAEVLEDAADEPETARKFAGRIRESADKLNALTVDLLFLARLEARGLEESRRRVDLCAIAQEAVEAQQTQACKRALRVEVSRPQSAPVHGDPIWLRRAVENLIGNAIQHSPPGGRIRVDLSAAAQTYSLAVADEGPGVDAAIRERLFTRFATTRHGDGGTGLGLAIVRAVAESHGGRAQLRSSGPEGAVFELTLPRAPGPAELAQSIIADMRRGEKISD